MFSLQLNVKRSISLNCTIAEAFNSVKNFNNWKHWSPWLVQEPDCQHTVSGRTGTKGHKQTWQGKVIGAGSMTLKKVQTLVSLQYHLAIEKPWKSESKVKFEFVKTSKGCKVSWSMSGKLPVYLFFMKKAITVGLREDYDRGLKMLKEFIEKKSVNSKVVFNSKTQVEGFYYLGINHTSTLDALPRLMSQDFKMINKLLSQNRLTPADERISLYHKMDLGARTCEYTSGLLYRKVPFDVPDGFVQGRIDSHAALSATHTGSYQHLGNAWSTLFHRQRQARLRISKKLPLYELYHNSPLTTDDAKLQTQVFLPLA